jgi:cell division protein FtsQ
MRRPDANPLLLGLAGAGLLLGAAACTWQGLRHQDDGPRRLYVDGELRHVDDRAIVAAAQPYLDVDFFDLDLDAIHRAVAAEPWLASVRVYRRWPDGVVVRVREHRAMALWGEDAVLAADGALFVPRDGERPADLPRLSGPDGSQDRLRARLPALQAAVAPAGHGIVRLSMDPRGAWEAELDNGLTLRLGRAEIEERTRRFTESAAPALGERLQSAGYVDLRYSDGFAVGGTRTRTADEGGEHEQAA